MGKNVASDIPLVEKNWWPPDFNNLTILRLPLLSEKTAVDKCLDKSLLKKAFYYYAWLWKTTKTIERKLN